MKTIHGRTGVNYVGKYEGKSMMIGGFYINILSEARPDPGVHAIMSINLLKWVEESNITKEGAFIQDYFDGPKGIIGIAFCRKCSRWMYIMRGTERPWKISDKAMFQGVRYIITPCDDSGNETQKCKGQVVISANVFAKFKEPFKRTVKDNKSIIVDIMPDSGGQYA